MTTKADFALNGIIPAVHVAKAAGANLAQIRAIVDQAYGVQRFGDFEVSDGWELSPPVEGYVLYAKLFVDGQEYEWSHWYAPKIEVGHEATHDMFFGDKRAGKYKDLDEHALWEDSPFTTEGAGKYGARAYAEAIESLGGVACGDLW